MDTKSHHICHQRGQRHTSSCPFVTGRGLLVRSMGSSQWLVLSPECGALNLGWGSDASAERKAEEVDGDVVAVSISCCLRRA